MPTKYNPFTDIGRDEIRSYVYDHKQNVLSILLMAICINIFVIFFIYMNAGGKTTATHKSYSDNYRALVL